MLFSGFSSPLISQSINQSQWLRSKQTYWPLMMSSFHRWPAFLHWWWKSALRCRFLKFKISKQKKTTMEQLHVYRT